MGFLATNEGMDPSSSPKFPFSVPFLHSTKGKGMELKVATTLNFKP